MSQTCVVCNQNDLKEGLEGKVKIPVGMEKIGPVEVWDKEIYCWIFKTPKVSYRNKWASAVMSRNVIGTAILVSNDGVSAKEVESKLPKTWSAIAKQLPPLIKAPKTEAVTAAPSQKTWDPPCGDPCCEGCAICDEESDEDETSRPLSAWINE